MGVFHEAEQQGMTEHELNSRVEVLEFRLAHQEAAIEELTRTVLAQEQQVGEQAETIRRLEAQVRSLTSAPPGAQEDEIPPHY